MATTKRRTKPATPPADSGDHAALIEALARDSSSVEAYLVLADLLQAAGDPRGELIAIQIALASAPADAKLQRAEAALLKRHEDVLLGALRAPLAVFPRGDITLTWRYGFLDAVRVAGGERSAAIAKFLRALFASPSAVLLRSLHLQLTTRKPAPIVATLAKYACPTLRRLRMLSREASLGELAGVWARLPRLESVEIGNWDGFDLGTLELPELRRLSLVGPRKRELDAILATPRPTLASLELDIRSPTPKRVYSLLEGAIPSLRHLGLQTNDRAIDLSGYADHGLVGLALQSATSATVRAIARSGAPLRSLRLLFASDVKPADYKPILDGALPTLKDLLLPMPDHNQVAKLAASKVLRGLETLVLTYFDTEELQLLFDKPGRFAHLRRIDLLGSAGSDPAAVIDALKAKLPIVQATSDRLIAGSLAPEWM